MARLNDTRAIAEEGREAGERHSISTRKISNGYIVEKTTSNPNTGEWSCSETYMDRPPKIMPARVSRGPSPDQGEGNSLADTMKYLNQDKS